MKKKTFMVASISMISARTKINIQVPQTTCMMLFPETEKRVPSPLKADLAVKMGQNRATAKFIKHLARKIQWYDSWALVIVVKWKWLQLLTTSNLA